MEPRTQHRFEQMPLTDGSCQGCGQEAPRLFFVVRKVRHICFARRVLRGATPETNVA